MKEFLRARLICQEGICTEMKQGMINKLTHRATSRERRNSVLLLFLDTSPGSVGVWTRHAFLLIRSSAEQNWAAAASCCLPTIFSLWYTPTCNPPTPPLFIHSFPRAPLLAADRLSRFTAHSLPFLYHITADPESFHAASLRQHTGWRTGTLHKDNVGQMNVCGCVDVSPFIIHLHLFKKVCVTGQ